MDNVFDLVIKQTGTTLPMEIVDNQTTRETSFTPTVTYVEEVPAIEAVIGVDAVIAVDEVQYVAEIVGKKEEYTVTAGVLTEGTVYDLVINTTTFSLTYTEATYPDKYDFLFAMRELVNADAITVTAIVDENSIYLSGDTTGYAYTVNGSDVFTIVQTQDAVVAVAGVEYVAPVEAVEAVTAVDYVPAIPAHYEATNSAVAVDLTELLEDLSGITKIEIQPEVAIASLTADAGVIPLVNDWYDIGVDKTITITPITSTANLVNPVPAIALRVRVTLDSTVDTFYARLYELETNTEVVALSRFATITDTLAGKIQLTYTATEASTLISSRGDKVDKYYLRPTYRMAIECNTVNNGSFIAKLPEVYVE